MSLVWVTDSWVRSPLTGRACHSVFSPWWVAVDDNSRCFELIETEKYTNRVVEVVVGLEMEKRTTKTKGQGLAAEWHRFLHTTGP